MLKRKWQPWVYCKCVIVNTDICLILFARLFDLICLSYCKDLYSIYCCFTVLPWLLVANLKTSGYLWHILWITSICSKVCLTASLYCVLHGTYAAQNCNRKTNITIHSFAHYGECSYVLYVGLFVCVCTVPVLRCALLWFLGCWCVWSLVCTSPPCWADY